MEVFWDGKTAEVSIWAAQTGIYCPEEHGRAMISEPEGEQSSKIR